MAVIIDGNKIAKDIKDEVKAQVEALAAQGKDLPCLAVVLCGDDPASKVYVGSKKKACEYTGIQSKSIELSGHTTEEELLNVIHGLNNDKNVSGILIQLPLPGHIREEKVLLAVAPEKDVDCFHPYNVGAMLTGSPGLLPCTPAGIVEMIKRGVGENYIEGKNCVVAGRSNIVGKPAAMLLLRENGTVTICHSKTHCLAEICREADILVAAVGKREFFTGDMVKEGAVVIDVGIHRGLNGSKKLQGDCKFDECSAKAGYITPVPGGVGPMTIAMLMKNCLEAYKMKGINE